MSRACEYKPRTYYYYERLEAPPKTRSTTAKDLFPYSNGDVATSDAMAKLDVGHTPVTPPKIKEGSSWKWWEFVELFFVYLYILFCHRICVNVYNVLFPKKNNVLHRCGIRVSIDGCYCWTFPLLCYNYGGAVIFSSFFYVAVLWPASVFGPINILFYS